MVGLVLVSNALGLYAYVCCIPQILKIWKLESLDYQMEIGIDLFCQKFDQ